MLLRKIRDPFPWIRAGGEVLVVCAAAGIDLLTWNRAESLRWDQPLPLWVVPLLTIIIYPVLFLRWRYPRTVFALHWTYALAGVALPEYVPMVGLLVALHALARCTSIRWAVAGLGACLVPILVNAVNVAAVTQKDEQFLGFTGTTVLWMALAVQVWGLGRLAYSAERRAERERQEQAAAAVQAERLNLARELHDIVSHSVSAMILQAAGARTLVTRQDDQVHEALKAIETTGIEAMGELHRLLGLLRSTRPEDDPNWRIAPASLQDLESLVSSVRAAGVDVEIVVEGHPTELDRTVGLTAYRIVQEALTNTIKHAGRGAAARVHLRWEKESLTLTIRDRAGLRSQQAAGLSSGHGLTGLVERVHLVGGSLETGPVADGFLVQAQLPSRPPVSLTSSPPVASGNEAP